MKSIILFLLLFINTSTINLSNYSIDKFKISLKKEGLFEIIESIKYYYGQDVAIISCEELNKNYCGNCKRLVKEYMPIDIPKEALDEKKEAETLSRETIDEWPTIQSILNKRFNLEESKLISDRIEKRAVISLN